MSGVIKKTGLAVTGIVAADGGNGSGPAGKRDSECRQHRKSYFRPIGIKGIAGDCRVNRNRLAFQ